MTVRAGDDDLHIVIQATATKLALACGSERSGFAAGIGGIGAGSGVVFHSDRATAKRAGNGNGEAFRNVLHDVRVIGGKGNEVLHGID